MERTSPACASAVGSAVIFRVFYLASLFEVKLGLVTIHYFYNMHSFNKSQ